MMERLSASCHCGACRYSFVVKGADLPFQPYLCSCNISRRISGVLLTAYVPVPSPTNPAPDLQPLSGYKSSDVLTRYFCKTCGTHMFLGYNDDGHFEVSTGSIASEHTDEVVKYKGHMWLEDTKDGGASVWIPKLVGEVCERHARGVGSSAGQLPLAWRVSPDPQSSQTGRAAPQERLHAHCHCGGVDFYITRPDENSLKASSPLPDVLVPYDSGVSTGNSQDQAWWIAKDKTRYLAGHCACQSCRRIAGFDLIQWAFVPLANVQTRNGSPIISSEGTLLDGAVEVYESSPGAKRSFCKTCGCSVFWQGAQRPTVIDISAGLLDAESGARAEEWLEWTTSRVSFYKEAHNRRLVDSLRDGLASWDELGSHVK